MSSPVLNVPEWYFTAQYAILRRVPSKGWGNSYSTKNYCTLLIPLYGK